MSATVIQFRSRRQIAWAGYVQALASGSDKTARDAWALYAAELPHRGERAPVAVVAKEGQG